MQGREARSNDSGRRRARQTRTTTSDLAIMLGFCERPLEPEKSFTVSLKLRQWLSELKVMSASSINNLQEKDAISDVSL